MYPIPKKEKKRKKKKNNIKGYNVLTPCITTGPNKEPSPQLPG